MKKILFTGELPPNIYHGVSLSNRINIEILSCKFDIIVDEEITYSQEHKKNNFSKLVYNLKRLKSAIRICNKSDFDYLYITFPTSKLGALKTLLYIYIFNFYNTGKVIAHIHRGDIVFFLKKSIINKILFEKLLSSAQTIIVLSEKLKNYIADNFSNGNNISVLNNTIEQIDFELNKPISFFDKSKLKFIFVTNYIEEKGILLLLEAFRTLEQLAELHCYGEFMDLNIEKKIRSYESDYIKINGPVYGIEKYSIMNDSDILILPSYNEGKPLVLIEAMSVGTIIICSKVGYIEEMFPKDYPFFLNTLNVEEIVLILNKVINLKPSDRIKHSQILYNWYQSNFSIDIHRIKLYELFN